MIRMILADDEPIITRGIQKLLDWKSLGIEVIGAYSDGKQAMERILAEKPDIALLDIFMPGMTGIDILREVRALGLETRVIFISGFQDFQYARDALHYGASDYLLKPVIREELINAVENCLGGLQVHRQDSQTETEGVEDPKSRDLLRELTLDQPSSFLPAHMEVLWTGQESPQEKKLIRFSVFSFARRYLEERKKGIAVPGEESMVIILKETDMSSARDFFTEMLLRIRQENGHCAGVVLGRPVSSPAAISAEYAGCREMRRYFFFQEEDSTPVLSVGEKVFDGTVPPKEFEDCRRMVLEGMVSQDRDLFERSFARLVRLIRILSDGRKEDACYHFCTMVSLAEERILNLGLPGLGYQVGELLEQGRAAVNYRRMAEYYGGCLDRYYKQIRESSVSSEKKDILLAKNYIQEHYSENLSLEVLAGQVHMNSYYFSSFFKKHAGENFKDYVNHVRLEHALPLLVSTDRKLYEIASDVGFRDVRSFTELFLRVYGETPASYRKRLKKQ